MKGIGAVLTDHLLSWCVPTNGVASVVTVTAAERLWNFAATLASPLVVSAKTEGCTTTMVLIFASNT